MSSAPQEPELPPQPRDVPWPTVDWPEAAPEIDVDASLIDPPRKTHGRTTALLVVHRGRLVIEHYHDGVAAGDTQRSWSIAKSITHALVGTLLLDDLLALDAPPPIPAWSAPDDPRGAITLEQMLRMVDGLDFVEIYEETGRSDVVDMLFGAGKEDVSAYVEARALAHPPGRFWSYSSGTTNLIAAAIGRILSNGGDARQAVERQLRERVFEPIGMRSAVPRFDAAGTFIGSSYVFATPRDFARFGLLYLRDGVWDGKRILPAGWVDHARTLTPPSKGEYGAHWWRNVGGATAFSANGFQGQYIVVDPARDLVLVRLGLSSADEREEVKASVAELIARFPRVDT